MVLQSAQCYRISLTQEEMTAVAATVSVLSAIVESMTEQEADSSSVSVMYHTEGSQSHMQTFGITSLSQLLQSISNEDAFIEVRDNGLEVER